MRPTYKLSGPNFFTFVAKYDNKVIGGLTVYILSCYYSIRPIDYIYDITVLSNNQRKGIGKKLITYLTNYYIENGFEEAYL